MVANPNNFDDDSKYEEEHALGDKLEDTYFDESGRNIFLLSGNDVIAYNIQTGAREEVYRHDNRVIGLKIEDNLLVTFTTASQISLWQIQPKERVLSTDLKFPASYKPLWFYESNVKLYILAIDERQKMKNQKGIEECALFQLSLDNSSQKRSFAASTLAENSRRWERMGTKLVLNFANSRPAMRRCLAVGNGLCVRCDGKSIRLINFHENLGADDSEESDADEDLFKKFTLESQFNVENKELVEFTEVHIAGNSLYATLNVGRVYFWSDFKKYGIGPKHCTHITLDGHQPTICISEYNSLFVGTGKGMIYKYNMAGTSGVGRWHRLSYLPLEVPPRRLALSNDSAQLVAISVDNSVCAIQTAEMQVTSNFQSLNTIPLAGTSTTRFDILNDPANSSLLVANARLGHIQWLDPFQWKTLKLLDVAEENVPHEDTFNIPNIQWLNTYLVHLTIPRVITCECRRNESQRTYLKFWRRISTDFDHASHFEIENCFTLPNRVKFIRSTLDECHEVSLDRMSLAENREEFLCIYSNGDMEVYKKDEKRSAQWCQDQKRITKNWQRSLVRSCSKIRDAIFATINALEECASVILWNLDGMDVLSIMDVFKDPQQVEWSPLPNVLLVACHSGLVAYDHQADTFVWAILQPGLSIVSNHIATFAHNGHEVFVFDPATGLLKRELPKFSERQQSVLPLELQGMLCFCGFSSEGSLSLLRPSIDEMPKKVEASKNNEKQTPFSQLFNNNEDINGVEDNKVNKNPIKSRQILSRNVSIVKFIDGPAYSLPPITQLAQQFVHACLTRKQRKKPL